MISWEQLTNEQKRGYDRVKSGKNRFCALLGLPGTGKSEAMLSYVSRLSNEGKKCLICGTTGIVAIAKDGRTLHQVLCCSPYDVENGFFSKTPLPEFREAEFIFIDEASMMGKKLFQALRYHLKKGQKVIFVGDLNQLPPTDYRRGYSDEENIRKCQLFGIVGEEMDAVLLTIRHRQTETDFLSCLDRIAEIGYYDGINEIFSKEYLVTGKNIKNVWERIIDRLMETADKGENVPFIANHNKTCDEVNNRCLKRLESEGRQMMIYSRKDSKTDSLDDLQPGIRKQVEYLVKKAKEFDKKEPATESRLYMGEKVMISINDWQTDGSVYRYANGSVGVITALDESYVEIRLWGNSRKVRIKAVAEQACVYYMDVDGKTKRFVYEAYESIPVVCAYAITTHKSQGMTIAEAFMDPSGAFLPGQVYTMLSRVKTKAGVHLIREIKREDVIINPFAAYFYRFVLQYSRGYTMEELEQLIRCSVVSDGRVLTAEETRYLDEKKTAIQVYNDEVKIIEALKNNGLQNYARKVQYDLKEMDDIISLIDIIRELDLLTDQLDPRLPSAIIEGVRRGDMRIIELWMRHGYKKLISATMNAYPWLEYDEEMITAALDCIVERE